MCVREEHLGYDKKVDFCSWADVWEDDKAIVLKQDVRWCLFCYNPSTQPIVKGKGEGEGGHQCQGQGQNTDLQKMQEDEEAILLTGATRSVLLTRNINRVSGINIPNSSAAEHG